MKLPRLKEWRQRRGYTHRDLSESAGVYRSTIWRIEAQGQEARPSTARKLAEALAVQIEDLMDPGEVGSRPLVDLLQKSATDDRPLLGTDLKTAMIEADERDGWRGQKAVLEEQIAKISEDHPLRYVYEALRAEIEVVEGKVLTGAFDDYGRTAGRFYLVAARAVLRLMLDERQVPRWLTREAYKEGYHELAS